MAVYKGYKTYSTDSVGSDVVFTDESHHYQGMLRAMDERKDERDRVQKKTFTKWVNKHLVKAQRHITDLYEDLRDGHNLISLLEVLSGETLPRERDVVRNSRLVSWV
ncbi:plectin-like isoform X2 [Sinocyclocheilus grahami]|uniref:plectin-like isoform X2 n=1 Tax=Sinocyclocheilus grahami TaxID=75366 RepID=UPI0007AC85E7|nr:PREDICTED: plectin-like isoform X2 [Sinocyclocheilus grahami]